jgi:hypothetical protein
MQSKPGGINDVRDKRLIGDRNDWRATIGIPAIAGIEIYSWVPASVPIVVQPPKPTHEWIVLGRVNLGKHVRHPPWTTDPIRC